MSGRPFSFYEFFAGGGMARAGLGDGWECLFANDFNPVKTKTYRENWGGEHLHEGDVWRLSAADLPGRADLAWASSPCQDLSLAGKRSGLSGARSSAFWGFWGLIEQLAAEGRAPRTVVIENVTGLLSSHGGEDFTALCRALDQQGYRFGALEIDAAHFVPQSRPRLFVVATRQAAAGHLTRVEPTEPFQTTRIRNAYDRLPLRLRKCWEWWALQRPPIQNQDIAAIVQSDVRDWHSENETQRLLGLLSLRHREKLQRAVQRQDTVYGTLFRRMRVEDGVKHQRSEIRFDGLAGCLRTPGGGSSRQFLIAVEGENVRSRAFTPIEEARLMGLSDDYRLPNRPTNALRVLGDGVVSPVVAWLCSELIEPMVVEAREAEKHGQETKGRRSRA